MKTIVNNIMKSGFDGILVIASNPVDVLTYVARQASGLPVSRVIELVQLWTQLVSAKNYLNV